MITKSREVKLILKIVEDHGGDEKRLLKGKIERLMRYQKLRILRNIEEYVDKHD